MCLEPAWRISAGQRWGSHSTTPWLSKTISTCNSHCLPLVAQVGQSSEVDALLMRLRKQVWREVRLQHDMMRLQGLLDPILAGAMSLPLPTQRIAAVGPMEGRT